MSKRSREPCWPNCWNNTRSTTAKYRLVCRVCYVSERIYPQRAFIPKSKAGLCDLVNFNSHRPITMTSLLFMPVSSVLVTPCENGRAHHSRTISKMDLEKLHVFFYKHTFISIYGSDSQKTKHILSIFLSLIFVYQMWKVIGCPNCCPKLVILAI